MVDDIYIGNRIRKYRELKGLSQRELADRLTVMLDTPVSVQTVSAWELGKRSISAVMVLNIAQCLQIVSYRLVSDDSHIELSDIIPILAEHEVDILNYIIRTWDGDARILLEFDLLYASLPPTVRYEIAQSGIQRYREYIKKGGRSSHDVPLRLQSIIASWRKLHEEE